MQFRKKGEEYPTSKDEKVIKKNLIEEGNDDLAEMQDDLDDLLRKETESGLNKEEKERKYDLQKVLNKNGFSGDNPKKNNTAHDSDDFNFILNGTNEISAKEKSVLRLKFGRIYQQKHKSRKDRKLMKSIRKRLDENTVTILRFEDLATDADRLANKKKWIIALAGMLIFICALFYFAYIPIFGNPFAGDSGQSDEKENVLTQQVSDVDDGAVVETQSGSYTESMQLHELRGTADEDGMVKATINIIENGTEGKRLYFSIHDSMIVQHHLESVAPKSRTCTLTFKNSILYRIDVYNHPSEWWCVSIDWR